MDALVGVSKSLHTELPQFCDFFALMSGRSASMWCVESFLLGGGAPLARLRKAPLPAARSPIEF